MRAKHFSRRAIASLAVLLIAQPANLRSQTTKSSPPQPAPVRPVTDDLYGTKVIDLHRYTENLQDAGVQVWIGGQKEYARTVLARIPGRQQLLARIRERDSRLYKLTRDGCRAIFT